MSAPRIPNYERRFNSASEFATHYAIDPALIEEFTANLSANDTLKVIHDIYSECRSTFDNWMESSASKSSLDEAKQIYQGQALENAFKKASDDTTYQNMRNAVSEQVKYHYAKNYVDMVSRQFTNIITKNLSSIENAQKELSDQEGSHRGVSSKQYNEHNNYVAQLRNEINDAKQKLVELRSASSIAKKFIEENPEMFQQTMKKTQDTKASLPSSNPSTTFSQSKNQNTITPAQADNLVRQYIVALEQNQRWRNEAEGYETSFKGAKGTDYTKEINKAITEILNLKDTSKVAKEYIADNPEVFSERPSYKY